MINFFLLNLSFKIAYFVLNCQKRFVYFFQRSHEKLQPLKVITILMYIYALSITIYLVFWIDLKKLAERFFTLSQTQHNSMTYYERTDSNDGLLIRIIFVLVMVANIVFSYIFYFNVINLLYHSFKNERKQQMV